MGEEQIYDEEYSELQQIFKRNRKQILTIKLNAKKEVKSNG
jgi:hypothetical protein